MKRYKIDQIILQIIFCSYKYEEVLDYKRLTSNTAILHTLYTFPIAFSIAHRTIAYKHYYAHIILHTNDRIAHKCITHTTVLHTRLLIQQC